MKHMNDIFCIGKTSDSQNFNLHNHTTFSDGVYTVKELCQQASVNTITNFSITDHDTIDAYTKGNAFNIGKAFGLGITPGVEATLKILDGTKKIVHMLLYFDRDLITDKQFIKDVHDTIGRVRSDEVMQERIKAYNSDLGIDLNIKDFDELKGKGGFPGYSRGMTMKMFAQVIQDKYPSLSPEEMNDVLSPKREDYIQPGLNISEMLYLKNKYDMYNVLAHPFRNKIVSLKEMDSFIKKMIQLGELDGVETRYPGHTTDQEVKLKSYNTCLRTGGSDTHKNLINMEISHIVNRDFEILSRKGDLGVMIGRVNPPQIGHIRVIKKAIKENGKLIFFLGSANKQDERNPFSCQDRMLFLETYFKQEIEKGILIIDSIDDVGHNLKWVQALGAKMTSHFPVFKGKVNIYGGDFKEDIAVNAIFDHLEEFPFQKRKVKFREIPRQAFGVLHNGKEYEISSTNLRKALKGKDFELAKKLMPREIGDLVLTKWREKTEEGFGKKMFFLYPPAKDKDGNIHRNFYSGNKIKQQIDKHFDSKHVVDEVWDSDVIVPVGGDGSLLYAIKNYSHLNKPFYPIASGTKNFIPASFVHPYQLLTEEVEEFTFQLMQATFYSKDGTLIEKKFAMNDVFLEVEQGGVGMLQVVGDEYPEREVTGNGLIICTPIGSTAYNKNAGGNILPLENDVYSITDIASESGTSDVVSANQTFTIEIMKGKFVAHMDGERIDGIDRVVVKKSEKQVKIILPKDNHFRKNRYV